MLRCVTLCQIRLELVCLVSMAGIDDLRLDKLGCLEFGYVGYGYIRILV
jgi:hypothetical protein